MKSNSTLLVSNQNQMSISLWLRVNGSAGQTNQYIFNGGSGILGAQFTSATNLQFLLADSTGYSNNLEVNITPTSGLVYHVVWTYDSGTGTYTTGTAQQLIYVNGVLAGGRGATGTSYSQYGAQPLEVGYTGTGSSGSSVSVEEFSIWNNHVLSPAEILGLRSRTATPLSLGTPAPYHYSLGANIHGGAPTNGDQGFVNHGTGTSSPTFAIQGTGSAIYSAETLTYTAPSKVADAYISKSGQLLFMHFAKSILGGLIYQNLGALEQSVLSVQVTNGGTGYTNPSATISGSTGGISAALGTPLVRNGSIVGIPVLSGGTNYYSTIPTTITITDTTGSGAAATPTMGAALNTVTSVNSLPTIYKNGVPINPAYIVSASLPNAGLGYTNAGSISLTISGGGGSGASASCVVYNQTIVAMTVTNGGSGYTTAPTIQIFGNSGGGSGASVVATVLGGVLTRISAGGGLGYTSPNIAITGGGGSGATASATFPSTILTGMHVTNGGSGYSAAPAVYLQGLAGGPIATATAVISGGMVVSAYVGNGGAGYSSTAPIVVLAGGGGSGATAACTTATYNAVSYISGITVTNGGSGYTSPPIILFGGGAYQATATMTGNAVSSISLSVTTLPNGGSNYSTLPIVWLVGGGGSGAMAQPTIAPTYLTGIAITNIGGGYSTNPTITLTDPTGTGAAVAASLGPVWTSSSQVEPWICIPLSTAAAASDVFSYSAADSWITTYGGNHTGATTNGFISNYTGMAEPAFQAAISGEVAPGQTPMLLGVNLENPMATNYQLAGLSGNWLHRVRGGSGFVPECPGAVQPGYTVSEYYNDQIAFTFFTSGNWTNQVDSTGVALTAGPGVYFSGAAGSGAMAVCTVVNGAVTAISLTSGGSGYGSTTTVTIWGPGGRGATATCTISAGAVNHITLTAGGSGYNSGLWTAMWDESNPAQPSNCAIVDGYNTCNCSLVASTAGVLTGGTLVGVSNTYQVTYKSANPASLYASLALTLNKPSVSSGAIVTNTASNIWVFSPFAKSLDRTASNPEQGYIDYMTASNGKSAACIRTMDSSTTFDGISNVVDVTDRQMTGYFSWSDDYSPTNSTLPYNRSMVVTSAGPYTPGIIYCGDAYVGTTTAPSGAPQPYQWTATNAGFLAGYGNAINYFSAQFTTASPHRFKTGQQVSFGTINGGSFPNFTVNNGSNGTVSNYVAGGGNLGVVWVTSATTFVMGFYATNINSTTGASGGVNTLGSTISLTNCVASIQVPDYGSTPIESLVSIAASMPGCAYWLNVPSAATTATATAYANIVLSLLPAGRKVYVEYGNEMWSNSSQAGPWLGAIYSLATGGSSNSDPLGYLQRAAQIHAAVYAAFEAAGRGGEIRRMINCQFISTGVSTALNAASNSSVYSSLGLSKPIEVDAVGFAPYLTSLTDPSILAGRAAVAASVPGTLAFGSSVPWSFQMANDLMKHEVLYRQDLVGTGLNGQLSGFYPGYLQSINGYNATTGYNCQLVTYEGFIQQPYPPGISTTDPYVYLKVTQDIIHSPGWYDTMMGYFASLQNSGVTLANPFGLIDAYAGGDLWSFIQWFGQPAGYGSSNQYWLNTGVSALVNNQSPGMQAWQDWAAAANVAPPPAVTAVTPYAGATGVSTEPGIAVTFSISMTPTTIGFTLTDPTGQMLPTTFSYNSLSRTAFITPLSTLIPGTLYTASVTSGLSTLGASLPSLVSWSFRTKSARPSRWFPGLRRPYS
jgi:hypothetical protein